MASEFKTIYSEELRRLREHAQAFAQANPALAPMLGATSTDPDVERLLEGVAFLNGLTIQKLDDEFPEIAQELCAILVPHILRPIPAATMVVFEPKAVLKESVVIAAGTELAATPVDGVSCRFRTTTALEVNQLRLNGANVDQLFSGEPVIRLELRASSTSRGVQLPNSIKFFLGENEESAAMIFMLLHFYCETVVLVDGEGNRGDLTTSMRFPGFDEALLPQPKNGIPTFGLIRELLAFPQKFLFVEFAELNKRNLVVQTEAFTIEMRLKKSPHPIPQLTSNSFMLHVTPAVNLFKVSAEPVNLDHESHEYLVLPDGVARKHYQIYSLDGVTGLRQGQVQQTHYVPFSLLQFGQVKQDAMYRTTVRRASTGDWVETYISVAYQQSEIPSTETLSIDMTCTNRWLPEALKLGDVSRPTNTSPERCSFRNITPIRGAVDVPTDERLLWACIAHAAMNFMSLGSIDTLQSLLRLYAGFRTNDHTKRSANERQIDGMLDLEIIAESRIYRGTVVQGQTVRLRCDQTFWPSIGSLYLWGSVLSRFIASFATINVYTRFELTDRNTGVSFKWPPMLGNKPLI
jgi:type VI secretion system protein ImpG